MALGPAVAGSNPVAPDVAVAQWLRAPRRERGDAGSSPAGHPREGNAISRDGPRLENGWFAER